MDFEVTISITIDPDSAVLGSDPKYYLVDIEDFFKDVLYDMDDISVLEIYVKES